MEPEPTCWVVNKLMKAIGIAVENDVFLTGWKAVCEEED